MGVKVLKDLTKWNLRDTTWVLVFFGTAIGAGIQFLPLAGGMYGFWPLLIALIIITPILFWAHEALALFVMASKGENTDLIIVSREQLGDFGGFIVSILYFLALYPIFYVYSVGLTNIALDLIPHSLPFGLAARAATSFCILAVLGIVLFLGEKAALKLASYLVYPLIIVLAIFAIALIPHWNSSMLTFVPEFWHSQPLRFSLLVPLILFSVTPFPSVSVCASDQKRFYGPELGRRKYTQIQIWTQIIVMSFTMLFVLSALLVLTPVTLAAASKSNMPILSYFSHIFDNPIYGWGGAIVAITAIITSFFGITPGTREGAQGIVEYLSRGRFKAENRRHMKLFSRLFVLFILLSTWPAAIFNLNISYFIGHVSGPLIAILLFFLPMFAIYKMPALRRFRRFWLANGVVVLVGVLSVISVFL